MRCSPEWMQLDTGISISRYFPRDRHRGLAPRLGQREQTSAPSSAQDQRDDPRHGTPPYACGERPPFRAGDGLVQIAGLFEPLSIVHDQEGGREMMAIRPRIGAQRGWREARQRA